jgi:hypothetical protein
MNLNITNKIIPMKTKLFYVSVLIVSLLACSKENISINGSDNNKIAIYGKGELIEKTIPFDKITEIESTGAIDININHGETRSYTVKAQSNIMDLLTFDYQDNKKLIIGTDQKYNIRESKGIILIITSPDDIDNISILGVGNVNYFNGHSKVVHYDIAGVGNIIFNDFTADTCYINIAGVSNSFVSVNNLLNINIAGVGNVTFKGNPHVEQNISGFGTVIKSK